jgi:hypothetical protein
MDGPSDGYGLGEGQAVADEVHPPVAISLTSRRRRAGLADSRMGTSQGHPVERFIGEREQPLGQRRLVVPQTERGLR